MAVFFYSQSGQAVVDGNSVFLNQNGRFTVDTDRGKTVVPANTDPQDVYTDLDTRFKAGPSGSWERWVTG